MALPHMNTNHNSPIQDYRYYVRVANDTAKQRQWNSARCMERSAEAYRDMYVTDTKPEKLAARRKQLADLLHQENMIYQKELRSTKYNPTMDYAVKDRISYLKEQKEIQRKKVLEEKWKQHLRLNTPELRQVESDLLKQHVIQGWDSQQTDRAKKEEQRIKEQLEEKMEMERASIREELERKKEEERKRLEAQLQASALREQMEKLRLREKESSILQAQEEELLIQEDEIARAEKLRAEMERRRERITFGRVLKAQALAALRRRSRQIQEELEVDLKILRSLAEKEIELRNVETSRKEKARADAQWMKQVMEEQLALEKQRESELDIMYREEAARQLEKREAQWNREAEARERLMREVLDGRVEQIVAKQEELRLAKEEALREKDELQRNLDILSQETSRQTERTYREKEERRRELDRITTERDRTRRWEEHQEKERKSQESRAAEEYADMIRNEARAMTARGYVPRGHRTGWM